MKVEEHASQKMLHVYISGNLSEQERVNIGLEIGRKCKDEQISKVIFDIREAELGYPLVGSHEAVQHLPDLGMSRNDYCAVIYSHNQEQLEHAKVVALNRGISNVSFFQSIEEGITWLTSKG